MTVGWIVLAPREYESRAKVYVRVGHELSTLDPSATTGQTVNIEQTLQAELNSMLTIAESRETAELVVADIGAETILANDLPDDSTSGSAESSPSSESTLKRLKNMLGSLKDRVLPARFDESEEVAIRALRNGVNIWSPAKSNIIEISYKAKHPCFARDCSILDGSVHQGVFKSNSYRGFALLFCSPNRGDPKAASRHRRAAKKSQVGFRISFH